MKVILLAATTVDGKIARDEHHFVDWSSPEDKKLFVSTTKRAGVVILGHNTYQTLPSPLPGRLHVVLTNNLAGKQGIPGQVEFTNQQPQAIIEALQGRGYTEAVLMGGAEINALFLKSGLVDEIWLTIEPIIFGVGIDLFRGVRFDLRPRLTHIQQLNAAGSVLLKYTLR